MTSRIQSLRAEREAAALNRRPGRRAPRPAPTPADAEAPLGAVAEHVLRRTGRRPLRFDGVLIAQARSRADDAAFHYALRIYRKLAGGLVADIRFHRDDRADDDPFTDRFHVAEIADLDALMALLAAYDPAGDVDCADALQLMSLPDSALAAEEAAEALERMADEIEAARRHFDAIRTRLAAAAKTPA